MPYRTVEIFSQIFQTLLDSVALDGNRQDRTESLFKNIDGCVMIPIEDGFTVSTLMSSGT